MRMSTGALDNESSGMGILRKSPQHKGNQHFDMDEIVYTFLPELVYLQTFCIGYPYNNSSGSNPRFFSRSSGIAGPFLKVLEKI
jgi:hypothetical protein